MPALKETPGNGLEFTLDAGEDRVFLIVGNIEVHIHRADEGVVVDLYSRGVGADEPLASTYVMFNEAQEEIDSLDDEPEEESVAQD